MVNKKNIKQLILLVNLILLNACTTVIKDQDREHQLSTQLKSSDNTPILQTPTKELVPQICFTPPSGCATIITDLIDRARYSIYLQAYSFTANNIVDSLIKAKNRGVKIRAMFDRTSFTSRGSKVHILQANNINTAICKVPGIAHNKIIIVDEKIVVTGSYNFTEAAELRNAENIVIINNKDIAKQYVNNWHKLQIK